MKARTKLQIRVTKLSGSIRKITQSQEKWAHKECLPHLGYANKSSAFCLDCGETFSLSLIDNNVATCPHCKTKLTIEQTRNRTLSKVTYFAIAEIVEEFQVIRYFELWGHYKKGFKAKLWAHAIQEEWILPTGKTTLIGLKHTLNWNCDSWNGDWSIRVGYANSWGYNADRYEIYPRQYHPKSEFKPEYTKIGIDHNLKGLTFSEAVTLIPRSSIGETLIKAKRYDLLELLSDKEDRLIRYWPTIKIVLRNKYQIENVKDWIDYLDLLRFFGKDLRNAVYVCPNDLKAAHDSYVNKKAAYDKKIEKEKNVKKALQFEEEFSKKIKRFLGLQFTDKDLVIKPLETVTEFAEEGSALHHCIFTNNYFKRDKSLILSARIEDKPIETIEVDLSKMKVVQSRGLQNKATEYHDKIVSLVQKNISKIKKAYKKTA